MSTSHVRDELTVTAEQDHAMTYKQAPPLNE